MGTVRLKIFLKQLETNAKATSINMAVRSVLNNFPKNTLQVKSFCRLCQTIPQVQYGNNSGFVHQVRFKSSDRGKVADRFSWLLSEEKNTGVVDGLKKAYRTKLLPLEKHYSFHDFHSPPLNDTDFDCLPQVLVIGQYSTGKSSMIKYLLRTDFPGIRVGPEPTTDRFIIVSHGDGHHVVPGHALVMDSQKPYAPLSKFGSSFLNRLQLSSCPSPVLSGEKQRQDRGYDFAEVVEWFAERVDVILLMFDAHKLDISDEFRSSIEAMKGHEDKIRIVLNKADMVDHQELMRVYGALMWSLGKVFNTPEVARVYIVSFWDESLRYDINQKLFNAEEQDLFQDLHSLTRNSTLRKLNDLIKRARLVKVHALIIADIKNNMPMLIGKDQKKRELIAKLDETYKRIQKEYSVPAGDFPEIARMRKVLETSDFNNFPRMNESMLGAVDEMMRSDITDLMKKIPQEQSMQDKISTKTSRDEADDRENNK